jgi:hypothetical protein
MAPTIEELDSTVRTFYEGRGDAQKAAGEALEGFKNDSDSWLMVDKILSDAQYAPTKCQSSPLLPPAPQHPRLTHRQTWVYKF